jgi:hypothetical protein
VKLELDTNKKLSMDWAKTRELAFTSYSAESGNGDFFHFFIY